MHIESEYVKQFGVLLLTLALCFRETYCKIVTVNITQGTLVGKVEVSSRQQNYYAFRGIPYAKPPVGKLRFKVVYVLFSSIY